MDAVVLLATLLAQRGRVRRVEYSSFPAYDDLIKAGLIEETGVVSSSICDECEHPHDAKIVYEGSQYGYYCPDLGFTSKPRSELIAAQPNLSASVAQIADALACKRRKSSPVDKDTWRIGAINSLTGDVVLYLHPTLQDEQDIRELQAALANEMKSPFGVVLTANGTLSVPPYATAQLQDVLSFDPIAGELIVVADLRAIAGVPEQRAGGRPNDYRKPLGEIIAVSDQPRPHVAGKKCRSQGNSGGISNSVSRLKCPSLPTVKRYVSEVKSGS